MAPNRKLEEKKIYTSLRVNNYPPHPELVPKNDSCKDEEIFGGNEYGDAQFDVVFRAILKKKSTIASTLFNFVRPGSKEVAQFIASSSFREIMDNHQKFRNKPGSLSKSSIGDLNDSNMFWYSDAMFAQQNFNGTNPTTIELAGAWKSQFLSAAKRQNLEKVALLLGEADDSLYVQDCSYFRTAFGIKDADTTMSDKNGIFSSTNRWACASVTLFHLDGKGRLHPLGIVIDHKDTMDKSVVIFEQTAYRR